MGRAAARAGSDNSRKMRGRIKGRRGRKGSGIGLETDCGSFGCLVWIWCRDGSSWQPPSEVGLNLEQQPAGSWRESCREFTRKKGAWPSFNFRISENPESGGPAHAHNVLAPEKGIARFDAGHSLPFLHLHPTSYKLYLLTTASKDDNMIKFQYATYENDPLACINIAAVTTILANKKNVTSK